jgi:hypothetical protein
MTDLDREADDLLPRVRELFAEAYQDEFGADEDRWPRDDESFTEWTTRTGGGDLEFVGLHVEGTAEVAFPTTARGGGGTCWGRPIRRRSGTASGMTSPRPTCTVTWSLTRRGTDLGRWRSAGTSTRPRELFWGCGG